MALELRTQMAVREKNAEGPLLSTPDAVERYLADIRDLQNEIFVVISLNAKNRVIDRHLISIGTVSSSLVHPRETFRVLINDSASSCILAHNHPSGDPTPSADDIKITKQLISAGEIIGIKVLDHILIGSSALSLRESGLVKF